MREARYSMQHEKKRLVLLDSFRFIAITMVVLYHYYSRWTIPHPDDLYPYHDAYRNIVFDNGFLGVQFFFIISGFVIAFTIESCNTLREFLKKRFIRLFPPLLIFSIISFLLVPMLDPDNSLQALHANSFTDFIPSLSFVEPYFYNKILNVNWSYVDGAYWSLAIEVRFYIIFGVIYFLNRKNIFRNWCIFVIASTILWLVIREYKTVSLIEKNDIFNLFSYIFLNRYLLYFSLGILFYSLYKNDKAVFSKVNIAFISATISLLLLTTYVTEAQHAKFFILSLTASILMLLFIYKPATLSFLSLGIFQRIGIISYGIYLFHENVGVAMINYIINNLHISRFQFIVPLFVYSIVVIIANIIYSYYERPVSAFLKNLIITEKQPEIRKVSVG